MLLGIPLRLSPSRLGDNTYSNLAEANRAFWRQTILPLTARSARALTGWLAPAYGSDLRLVPYTDEIPALASQRRPHPNADRADHRLTDVFHTAAREIARK